MTVFLSYDHEDSAVVDRISDALLSSNVKMWRDNMRLSPGDPLFQKILEAIQSCSYFCVVLSRASVRSAWVEQEVSAALASPRIGRESFVLPLLIEDCEIPASLENFVAIDLRGDLDRGIRQLISRIGRKYNTNYSGKLSDERDYWFHFGVWTTQRDERLEFALDLVAYDIEEAYSVLAQITIETPPLEAADVELQNARFIRRLIWQFPTHGQWIKLSGADAWERAFDMDGFGSEPDAELRIRVVRLGTLPTANTIFPLYRYLVQLALDQQVDTGPDAFNKVSGSTGAAREEPQ